MSGIDWLTFVGLLLLLEGLLPLAAPVLWREGFSRMLALRDGQLRFIGATSMLGGVFLLMLSN